MILALRDGSKTMTRRKLGPKGPRFKAGDTIWVREAAYISPGHFCAPHDATCFDYDGAPRVVSYFADHGVSESAEDFGVKLRNPRFMPKWASRITLVVTESRVERLGGLSGEDAIREGVPCSKWSEDDWIDSDGYLTSYEMRMEQAFEEFTELWDSIHGEGSWNLQYDQDVEVISFEVQK